MSTIILKGIVKNYYDRELVEEHRQFFQVMFDLFSRRNSKYLAFFSDEIYIYYNHYYSIYELSCIIWEDLKSVTVSFTSPLDFWQHWLISIFDLSLINSHSGLKPQKQALYNACRYIMCNPKKFQKFAQRYVKKRNFKCSLEILNEAQEFRDFLLFYSALSKERKTKIAYEKVQKAFYDLVEMYRLANTETKRKISC